MAIPGAAATPVRLNSQTRNVAQTLALGAVWLTMALSSVVSTEPAPFDFMMVGLIIFLPLFGLSRLTAPLIFLTCAWLLVAACGFVSSLIATDTAQSARHTGITLYLSLACIAIAAFVLHNPARHARIIASGMIAAAVIAGIAGLVGYADIIPGGFDLLTLHGRASGTFKDPNVLGAFLTPTFVMALHYTITGTGRTRVWCLAALTVISVALLLSFSRSAWLTTFAATVLYMYLSVLIAPTNRGRVRLIILCASGVILTAVVLIGALQFKSVSSLLSERATLSQTHDTGPEGRFGGQLKAVRLILTAPLGIGSLEFRPRYHHEEPHNVWLAMFMNTGWLGGIAFTLLTIGTAIYGFRQVTQPSPVQQLYVAFYAGYIGTLMGGLVVDSDHWRHFYLLMGVLWGVMLTSTAHHLGLAARRTRFLNS